MLQVRRDTLVRCLLAHDEDDLAAQAPSVTDEELKRIGERAEHYAFSEEHRVAGGSMGTARAVSLATVDALEDTSRELHRKDGQRRGRPPRRKRFAVRAFIERVVRTESTHAQPLLSLDPPLVAPGSVRP